MEIRKNNEINEILDRLKSGMLDYMPHASYKKSDVENCLKIIVDFLEQIEISKTKEEGMAVIEKVVKSLNELNEELEHELIETDQREDVAEVIILGGYLKGYNARNEDITEEWREW